MDLDADRAYRDRVMHALGEMAEANGGSLSRRELSYLPVDDGVVRLLDVGRGIRNPHELNATLAVLSTPDGPYDDGEIDGGLIRYKYEDGGGEGSNTKLRRAWELRLPIIYIRKAAKGVFAPYFPV